MNAQSRPHPGLLPLSLQRLKHGARVPQPPTNEQRLQAFRNAVLPVIGNGYFNFNCKGKPA